MNFSEECSFSLDPNFMNSYSYTGILFEEPTLLPLELYRTTNHSDITANNVLTNHSSDPLLELKSKKVQEQLFEEVPKLLEESTVQSLSDQIESDCEHQHEITHVLIEDGPRNSREPTIFEQFTKEQIDWCRYCGVTQRAQTAAFRPGPWGKRTLCKYIEILCSKHGCDYKGYGYIEKEPRLNLTVYQKESLKDRVRPILQDWCAKCYLPHESSSDILVQCDGCCRAFHQNCHTDLSILPSYICIFFSNKVNQHSNHKWYCSHDCKENCQRGLVVPKKNLPLMRAATRNNTSPKKSEKDKKKRARSSSEQLLNLIEVSKKKKKRPSLPSEQITVSDSYYVSDLD